MAIRISVTADDIKYGSPRSPHGCALARAARRTLRRSNLYVWDDEVEIFSPEHEVFALSAEAKAWVAAFDRDPRSVKPVTISIHRKER